MCAAGISTRMLTPLILSVGVFHAVVGSPSSAFDARVLGLPSGSLVVTVMPPCAASGNPSARSMAASSARSESVAVPEIEKLSCVGTVNSRRMAAVSIVVSFDTAMTSG